MTGRVRHVPLGRHESVSRPSAWGRSPRSQRGPAAAGPASHWPWLRERRVGAGSACCTLAMRRSASGTIPALASCCWRTHVRRPSVEPRGRGERVSPLPHLRWRCGVRSAFLRLRDRFQRAERGGPPGGQGGRERADGEGEQDHEGEDAPRGGRQFDPLACGRCHSRWAAANRHKAAMATPAVSTTSWPPQPGTRWSVRPGAADTTETADDGHANQYWSPRTRGHGPQDGSGLRLSAEPAHSAPLGPGAGIAARVRRRPGRGIGRLNTAALGVTCPIERRPRRAVHLSGRT